jgi:uncharacterized protein
MKLLSICFFAALAAFSDLASGDDLPTMQLSINNHTLTAEIASTTETRTVGLMRRFSLKPDHGMVFVFNTPQPLAFWMKNTFVPLSIAFIGADGRILNIEDMAPQTETTHPSKGPALYTLEMKKGWFAERGIAAGDQVRGLERAPKARD